MLIFNFDILLIINGFGFNQEYISEFFNSNQTETFFSFIPRSIARLAAVNIIIEVLDLLAYCFYPNE